MPNTIIRLPSVLAEVGLSRSTLYQRISQGLWPKPVNLGGRAVGWPSREIETVNAALIAGQTNSEVRTLVEKLEAARKKNAAADDRIDIGFKTRR